MPDYSRVEVSPLLLRKGRTRLALYGLGPARGWHKNWHKASHCPSPAVKGRSNVFISEIMLRFQCSHCLACVANKLYFLGQNYVIVESANDPGFAADKRRKYLPNAATGSSRTSASTACSTTVRCRSDLGAFSFISSYISDIWQEDHLPTFPEEWNQLRDRIFSTIASLLWHTRSNIFSEVLHGATLSVIFPPSQVTFLRPRDAPTDWFNIFCIHQNRHVRGLTVRVPTRA